MEHHEGSFIGPRDLNIYYQYWLPEGEPRAVLLIVHGAAEHCGRYGNVVDYLVPRGYAVYSFDNVGHGQTDGTRCHMERIDDFVDPIRIYHEMVRDWQPAAPIFIYGHSMGGLLVATYLLDHQAGLSGAVFTAPAVEIPPDISSLTVAMSGALSTVAPSFRVVGIEAESVSRDPEVVQAYVNDPLVYTGKYTARMGAELLGAMKRVTAEAGEITLPVLIVHGSEDYLIAPSASQMLYDNAGSEDKTLKLWDGLYHEVHNEPERKEVLAGIEAWLEAHLPAAS